ncbi:MAG: hypothetical protein BWY26_00648 [Elusimicrobia bacterium ADurb.Bin231]|nr:MAG: hypothetical protein BWY26_00648 [Elusimicrobia bacterium ADurb.Bin231]
MMKECPHCGAKNPENNEKCQWCGKGFDEPVEENKPSTAQENNNMLPKEKKGIFERIKQNVLKASELYPNDGGVQDMKELTEIKKRFRNKDLKLVHCLVVGGLVCLPPLIIFSQLSPSPLCYLLFFLFLWFTFSFILTQFYSKKVYEWNDIRVSILLVVFTIGMSLIFYLFKIAGVDMNRMPLFY